MKRELWKDVYGTAPEALNERVSSVLSELEEEEIVVKRYMIRTAALVMGLMLLVVGTVWAVAESGILSLLDRYGETLTQEQQKMIQKEFRGTSIGMGNVHVEVKEMISDGIVGMVTVEFTTPEGMYLYTDLVNMTKDEWEMDRAARFAKYGPYEELGDIGIGFTVGEFAVEKPSEIMVNGERLADNKIRAVAVFPVEGHPLETLGVTASALPVTSATETAERNRVGLAPEYTMSLKPVQTVAKEFETADTSWGLRKVTVSFSELSTKITAEWTGIEDYYIVALDANGEDLSGHLLGSLIYESGAGFKTIGCGAFAEIPNSIYLQAQLWDASSQDMVNVGEAVEIKLK